MSSATTPVLDEVFSSSDPTPMARGLSPFPGPLLVAFRDDDVGRSVVRVAATLQRRYGAQPHVLEAFDVSAYGAPIIAENMMAITDALLASEIHDDQIETLRRRVGAHVPSASSWPMTIELGSLPFAIRRKSEEIHPSMIVMGLHHHGKMDRALGIETTRYVIRDSPVPVLAVTSALQTLPQHVAVAVDFSRASLRAAKFATWLVGDGGILDIVYVEPKITGALTEEFEGQNYIRAVGRDAALVQLAEKLRTAVQTVRTTVLVGEPVEQISTFVARTNPELLALGSQRHPWLSRLLIGSVTSALVNAALCSTLVTPPLKEPA